MLNGSLWKYHTLYYIIHYINLGPGKSDLAGMVWRIDLGFRIENDDAALFGRELKSGECNRNGRVFGAFCLDPDLIKSERPAAAGTVA